MNNLEEHPTRDAPSRFPPIARSPPSPGGPASKRRRPNTSEGSGGNSTSGQFQTYLDLIRSEYQAGEDVGSTKPLEPNCEPQNRGVIHLADGASRPPWWYAYNLRQLSHSNHKSVAKEPKGPSTLQCLWPAFPQYAREKRRGQQGDARFAITLFAHVWIVKIIYFSRPC